MLAACVIALSLKQALQIGLHGNLQLQATRQDEVGAAASTAKAEAAYYPTLSGSIGAQNTSVSPGVAAPSTGWAPGLTLSYDLGTDGSRKYQVEQAEDQASAAHLTTVLQVEQTRLSITNAYYDLQNAEAQVVIDRKAVDYAKESLVSARAMRQAGLDTSYDTESAQTQLASARQTLESARGQVDVARSSLANLLGLGLSAPVEAIDPVTPAGTWSYSLSDSELKAIRSRPEIGQARLSVDQARLSLALDYASAWPKTSLQASVAGTQGLYDGTRPVGGAAGALGLQTTLGVSATIPIFGDDVGAGIAQGKAQIAAARARALDADRSLRFQVEQAYSQLQSSYINIATSQLALKTSQDAVEGALERFKAGLGTQTDVISAENNFTSAQGSHLSAVISYDKALASLQVLAGTR